MKNDQLQETATKFFYGPDCPSTVDRERLVEVLASVASQVRREALADATEQCAIEAGERSPEGVSSHSMLGDMWDERIQKLRAETEKQ